MYTVSPESNAAHVVFNADSVKETFEVLVVILLACVDVMPVLAVFAVIAFACVVVIVVVLPAKASPEPVPTATLLVPAPISLLKSEALLAVNVLSAFILMNVTALGLVN